MTRVTVKNLNTQPAQIGNLGGAVQVDCAVFTDADDAAIKHVTAAAGPLVGPADQPLRPVPGQYIKSTREGFYRTTVPVPWLTEPGRYDIDVVARDTEGYTGRGKAALRVAFDPPTYRGGPLTAENRAVLVKAGRAPIIEGNRAELLWDGRHALASRLELIAAARRQINLQNYVFEFVGAGKDIYDTLLPRLNAGVEANILLNASTQIPGALTSTLRLSAHRILAEIAGFLEDQGLTLGADGDAKESARRFDGRKSNVNLILFAGSLMNRRGLKPQAGDQAAAVWLVKMIQDAWGEHFFDDDQTGADWRQRAYQGPGGLPAIPLLDYAIHEKILIVDGRRAIVGGRNLADAYFEPWIDTDVLLDGPIVREVQKGFSRSFSEFAELEGRVCQVSAPRVRLTRAGEMPVQFVQSRPWRNEVHTLHVLVTALAMARRSIRIYSQYLVLPNSLLLDSLLAAARRGVDVRIYTNSQTAGQELYWSTGYFISLNYFARLVREGVRIFLNPGVEGRKEAQPYLHAKEFIIDDELVMSGSFNLSLRSCFVESENLVNIFHPALAAAECARFDRHTAAATEVTSDFLRTQYRTNRTTADIARTFELFF